ncbi:hypothetical protein [Streptomyces sp. TRM68367]|uniref:hypothetical protein n=1 Tax=Streptomyces sp. TRM68367 TaxID=2758415 RepID=UPI00165ADB77|nr:hypothetical protein [Streptomyces sp. TRM68367]MBC9727646.1 hypothetical protein [Streptomyces sp. TRM68367]
MTTPAPERPAPVRLVEEAFVCVQACEACAAACQPAVPAVDPTAWNRVAARCARTCEHTSMVLNQLPATDTADLRAQVELCALTCEEQAAEFGRHAADDRHGGQADSCRRCAQACRSFLTSLG